jgi:hypothetical protein
MMGGGYFGPALTPVTSSDPLLLKDKLQSEETISELRKRKGNKSGAFYKEQVRRPAFLLPFSSLSLFFPTERTHRRTPQVP